MATHNDRTLYLVQAVNWYGAGEDDLEDEDEAFVCPDPTHGKPLVAFTTREAAKADAARREALERKGRNPFDFGATHADRSTMPEGVFRDLVTDLELTPPPARRLETDWAGWWERHKGELSAQQRRAVWDALDRVCFYTVVALEPPGK
jgi:hypothetical protein